MIVVIDMFSFEQQANACNMLDELKKHKLSVIKIRRDDVWVRLAVESNPSWYRSFCDEYSKSRKRYPKVRTYIKRCNTIKALENIINDVDYVTPYMYRLIPYVDDYVC